VSLAIAVGMKNREATNMSDYSFAEIRKQTTQPWAERWRVGRSKLFTVSVGPERRVVLTNPADAVRWATLGLFAFACIAAAYVAQGLLVPILLAWVVATVLMPLHFWLQKKGAPRGLSALAIGIAMMILIATVVWFFSLPLTQLIGRAGELSVVIKEKMRTLTEPLALMEELRKGFTGGSNAAGAQVAVSEGNANIATSIMSVLTPAVSQFVIFFGTLIFYLIYRRDIAVTAEETVHPQHTKWGVASLIRDVESNMAVYFGTVTLVNLALGVIATILAMLAGLPNPLMFGVLAMVVNFIPYLGDVIILSAFFITGLLTFPTVPDAFIVPIVYILVSTLEGHFVTPSIVGHRLTLNPFAVFLSIAFWTWLWGPAGAFLAVPIFLVTTVVIRHLEPSEETAPDGPSCKGLS
jgi:predicted PurR-regulated permease PerM